MTAPDSNHTDRTPRPGPDAAVAGGLVVLCLLGLAIGLIAVARSPQTKVPKPGSTIHAVMAEWSIDTPKVLRPGTYTFDISNTGTMEHEMLVMRTNLQPAALPMKDGDINEDALPPMSDGENVAPGKSQTRKITFTPGQYLFVCNIPGHFGNGMYTYVTVR